MFGMSVFQSVLERLKTEKDVDEVFDEGGNAADDPAGTWSRHAPIDRCPAFIVETSAQTTAFGTVDRAYRELAPVDRTEPPVMPAYLARTSLAEIAEELALGDVESALTLAAKRRRFAAGNHPDRLPAEFRANATIRMKLANMLIDEAARRLGRTGAR